MKTASKERPLQWIVTQHGKGNISFSHKLQRPIGQWNPKMKSLLIHSLLAGFPVNPIYVVEEEGTIYTLDGSQRTSTCIGYLNNEFALSKDTPNVVINSKVDGELVSKEYEIAGKKFKKLDPDVQTTLLACSLEFCTLSDYTDAEVKEMFSRQNSGRPLNNTQKRASLETDEMSTVIFNLASHEFFNKTLTKAQHKRDVAKDLVREVIMLTETDAEHDYAAFKNNNIDNFIVDYQEHIDYGKIDVIKAALDKLNENFEELKVNTVSIPMIVYSVYRVIKDKKSFAKLVEEIKWFIEMGESSEAYHQYCLSGTTSGDNVRGRLDFWRNIVKKL